MKKTPSFTKRFSAFSAAIALLLYLVQIGQNKFELSYLVWLAYIYFMLLSLATFFITRSGIKKDNKTFITRTYGAIGIRFIFSIFPLLIYLLFNPAKEMPFIVTYVLLYFLYTSFEIYFLVVNLRPDFKKTEA